MLVLVSLLFMVLIPSIVMGQEITNVSGSFDHGNSVDISGSSFGIKSIPEPVTWDSTELGDFSPDWQGTGVLEIGNSTRHPNSSYCGTKNMSGESGTGAAFYTSKNEILGEKWFCQYWFKLDENFDWGTSGYGDGDDNLANVKIFRMWNPANGRVENFHVNIHGWTNSITYYAENVSDAGGGTWGDGYITGWAKETWHCIQFQYGESTPGLQDGSIKIWLNGIEQVNDQTIMTRDDETDLKRPFIIGFYDAWGDAGTDRDDFYIDDIYSDNSWSRVEIGNSINYNSCTHREIQIPTAWDDQSISIEVNMGSFSLGEDLFLFVVDNDGNVSDGRLISGDWEAPGQTGQPMW